MQPKDATRGQEHHADTHRAGLPSRAEVVVFLIESCAFRRCLSSLSSSEFHIISFLTTFLLAALKS